MLGQAEGAFHSKEAWQSTVTHNSVAGSGHFQRYGSSNLIEHFRFRCNA